MLAATLTSIVSGNLTAPSKSVMCQRADMTKDEAEELDILLLQVADKLDQSVGFVKDHDTEENFNKYREGIGKVMGYLYFGVKEPLWERYPNLKPEKLSGPYKVNKAYMNQNFMTAIKTHNNQSLRIASLPQL